MSLETFILERLRARLHDEAPTLLIYNPDGRGRYRALAHALAGSDPQYFVLDASTSFLKTRAEAERIWLHELPVDARRRLILYLPYPPPDSPQQKLEDPFWVFGLPGSTFPRDAADEYRALCAACYPGRETQLARLFNDPEPPTTDSRTNAQRAADTPDFAAVDALGGGPTWALLRSLTGGQSVDELLTAVLLAPADGTLSAAWRKQKGMAAEWKEFAKAVLGWKTTGGAAFGEVQRDLWRFLLFSEFAYDLPRPLPAELASVPRGGAGARELVLRLCETLRQRRDVMARYRQWADETDTQLQLSQRFAGETELGEIITFRFEDNTYLYRFLAQELAGELEAADRTRRLSEDTIWKSHDPARDDTWRLATCGAELRHTAQTITEAAVRACPTLAELVERYTRDWWRLDAGHRAFETASQGVLDDAHPEALAAFSAQVRATYAETAARLARRFQELVQTEGWPAGVRLRNTQVFDRYVQPHLNASVPTALIWADAFRYELGQALVEKLAGRRANKVELLAAAAFVPGITPFAMAALLPEAETKLRLRVVRGTDVVAELDGQLLPELKDRIKYLRTRFGDRVRHQHLHEFLSQAPSSVRAKPADLLCLSMVELDEAGENLSDPLPIFARIPERLATAVAQLRSAGYQRIVITADHGFAYSRDYTPGDNLPKPAGTWWLTKSRCLIGAGADGAGCLSLTPAQLGIRAEEIPKIVFGQHLGVFQRQTRYFHEGLSLPETIVPVVLVELPAVTSAAGARQVTLSYRGQTTEAPPITSRRPSLRLLAQADSLFAAADQPPLLVQITATAADGRVVGVVDADDEDDRLIGLSPGDARTFGLRMDDDFEGAFEVTATDPQTGLRYASLSLATAYES